MAETLKQIEKTENLNNTEFLDLLKSLIEKIGYSNPQSNSEYILASFNTPLNKDLHAFIIVTKKLETSESEGLLNKIIELKRNYNFHTTFICSTHHISNGFKQKFKNAALQTNINLDFIDRDRIIELVNEHISDYWKHDDLQLLDYEKQFCESVLKDLELKRLSIYDTKYQKLTDIFIEPSIYHLYEENETKTPIKKKVSIDNITNVAKPIVISGNAGMGKTTLLKKIGETLINQNAEKIKKNLPVFLSVLELYESNYKIKDLIIKKLSTCFPDLDDSFYSNYNVVLLIDTIDELEEVNQKEIINQLEEFYKNKNINYIIASRNFEKILSNSNIQIKHHYYIEKFNNEQIKQFVAKFFPGQSNKAEQLLDALRENRILEKLPISPLTISLISILYEENNLEIPATITDIYDNFNSLLVGKAVVSSRIEFIDISFKERILSLYALNLLERKEHNPMNKDEFIKYFKEYFENKTIPVKKGNLEDVLHYLIDNTGILELKNNKYVGFTHASFMEYYASVEIFKHQRSKEADLINNFFSTSWQNCAVFFGGKSKDMPEFLDKVLVKAKSATHYLDLLMGVIGIGYLLQALYQTDNKIRKKGVDIALDLNIQAHEFFMKLIADNAILKVKNYNLPILAVLNIFYFFENFNSITLKEPLQLSFKDEFQNYLKSDNFLDGYKSLKLALTLQSKRMNETNEMQQLVFDSNLVKEPLLCLLTDFSLEVFKGENYKNFKKEVRKELPKLNDAVKHLIEMPARRMRFTDWDLIRFNKKIKIITEGKTDAEIFEHAFITLSEGSRPYWEINPSGNTSGGAYEVAKALMNAKPIVNDEDIIIGIFDRDDKGLAEFNGLKAEIFKPLINKTIKKHIEKEIYAICLPIPAEKVNYINADQRFNFFALEHLFNENLLKQQDILSDTPIDGVYSIKDSKKKEFSKFIRKQTDVKIFQGFIELFQLIDSITGVEVEYKVSPQ
jgi:hypothetical protein